MVWGIAAVEGRATWKWQDKVSGRRCLQAIPTGITWYGELWTQVWGSSVK